MRCGLETIQHGVPAARGGEPLRDRLRDGLGEVEGGVGITQGSDKKAHASCSGTAERADSARSAQDALWGRETHNPRGIVREQAARSHRARASFGWPRRIPKAGNSPRAKTLGRNCPRDIVLCMSLGQIKPVPPAGDQAVLALVRDSAPTARAGDEAHDAGAAVAAPAAQAAREHGAEQPVADTLLRWKRLCERLESVAIESELSDALGCWLRIGAEPLGASGGLIEVNLGGSAGVGETLRASFGLDERSARAMSCTSVCGGSLPMPSATELVFDLAHNDTFGSLLVRPFLDEDGVLGVLSVPFRSKAGFLGVLRYCFAQRIASSDAACAMADLLTQRIVGLVESRLSVRRALAAESRLHAVLDGAGASIITAAQDGRIIEGNDVTAVIFGYQREELRSLSLSTLFPASSERLLGEAAIDAAAGQHSVEVEAQRRDGSTFIAEVVVGAGALQRGWTLVVRDASARRSADAQMRQCERLASIGTVAAGLGHDINNTLLPIRAHLSAISRLAKPREKADYDRHACELRAGLEHLQALADALHFLSADNALRPDAATDVELWWTLAAPLLEKTLHDRATLEIALEPDLPRVLIDERSLARIALKTLVNAGEAMPRERPRELARVLLRARRSIDGTAVIIEIADNGIGMTEEVRRRAFDAYFTTKMRGLGTGLGLPIVRGLVEEAGGRVELDTQPGVGTTVRIVLPAERVGAHEARQPRVAGTLHGGRLTSAVNAILATNGVVDLENDPERADIWIVSRELLSDGDAERWCAAHPAAQLVVLGSQAGDRPRAPWERGATVVPSARDLSSISAAIKQVLASASTSELLRGANHG